MRPKPLYRKRELLTISLSAETKVISRTDTLGTSIRTGKKLFRNPWIMTRPTPSILVVDDEVDTCRNLSDILTDLGYHVEVAHNGMSALEIVQKPFDVALLDFKMPGMDGLT